jgi:DNA-binding NtrC family response regulator
MPQPPKFLIVDDNPDSRFLLSKTLMRKFPTAVLVECGDDGTAVAVAGGEKLDAIVVHRSGERSGLEMLPDFRRLNPDVPIVMVSGIDRSVEAAKAGATYFLLYDEWLRIGTVVAGLLEFSKPGSVPPFGTGEADPNLASA